MTRRAVSWQSVHAEALRRLQAREWPPGARIPDEAALAAEFGCARATVNRALRALAEAGHLDRRRKAGTRVPTAPVRKATFDIPIIRQDVAGRGQHHDYRLLSDDRAALPAAARDRVGGDAGGMWRHVRALHLADGAPFCLEDRWINPAIVADDVRFDDISANEWLVRNVGFSAGDVVFRARAAGPGAAAALGCAVGEAIFVVDRATFLAERPITLVALCYAPGYGMATRL